MHADEKLLASPVGMLPAQFDRRNIKNNEVSGGCERHFRGHFTDCQEAAGVGYSPHEIDSALADAKRQLRWTLEMNQALDVDVARVGSITFQPVHVADHLGRIAFDDGVCRDGAQNDRTRANPGPLANRDIFANHASCVQPCAGADDNAIAGKDGAASNSNARLNNGAIRNYTVLCDHLYFTLARSSICTRIIKILQTIPQLN